MASALYPIGKKSILDADIDLLTDTIKAILIDTGSYTYSASHDFLNDVSGTVGVAQTLSNKTTTGGTFDADDITFPTTSGNSAEAIIIYKDTGNAATSSLIAYIDSGTGLPVTPNGGNITVAWNASGIFSI